MSLGLWHKSNNWLCDYLTFYPVILGLLTINLATRRPSTHSTCKYLLLPSQTFLNLNFKAEGTSCLFFEDIQRSSWYTKLPLWLETWQSTSSSSEVWCKSSHHYTTTLKKASHGLNKRFFLHLWHFSMSMNRSLSSLCSSSPHYPLWQESSSTLFFYLVIFLPFTPAPRHPSPHTHIPPCSFFFQQHSHFSLQMTAPEVNWKGGLLT